MVGATVAVKGSSTKTQSDSKGNFSITVNKGGTLVFTYAGMAAREVTVNSSESLDIVLEDAGINMNEVVVIGYGQQRKSLVTGAISSIKSDQLTTASPIRLDQALQGRTAGIQCCRAPPSEDQTLPGGLDPRPGPHEPYQWRHCGRVDTGVRCFSWNAALSGIRSCGKRSAGRRHSGDDGLWPWPPLRSSGRYRPPFSISVTPGRRRNA